MPDSNVSFRTATSVTDVSAVNPNVIKILVANGLSTFFIKR